MTNTGDPYQQPPQEPSQPQEPGPAPQQPVGGPPAAPPPAGLPTYGGSDTGVAAGAAPAAPTGPLSLAVKLMYVGAVLSVIGVVIGVADRSGMRDAIRRGGATLTPSQVDAALTIATVSAVVAGVIGVVLWILNAVFNARGAKWARILSTVLGAIAVVSTLASFAQHQPSISRALAVVQAVLAVVIVVLLWRPESSAYYDARSARPAYQ